MFNFKEAFTNLFKEKNWLGKYLIIYVLNLIIIIPSTVSSFISNDYSLSTSTKLYSYNSSFSSNLASSLYFGFLCFALIFLVPFVIASAWYMFEGIQASIQKRHAKAIWQESFTEILKKAAKYFIVNFVYGIMFVAIAFFVVGIFAGFFCLCSSLLLAGYSGATNTTQGVGAILGFTGGTILLICALSCFFLFLGAIAYVTILPAQLRLISTSTLNEGLNFKKNWDLTKKYKGTFIGLFLFVLMFGFLIGLMSGVGSSVASMIYRSLPAVGILIMLCIEVVTTAISVYFSYFVYTRLLGQVYRRIKEKEDN